MPLLNCKLVSVLMVIRSNVCDSTICSFYICFLCIVLNCIKIVFVVTQVKLKAIRSETDFWALGETCGLWSEVAFYETVLSSDALFWLRNAAGRE